ncbi:thioredoxin domain-containing protein [Pseudolysobacter antarcticus]|uniref:Thioredoxin domain-containing protein n=1 Tax=Pseudolysobacter antarcticus TaxID=2511995 RepID=A0A411HNT8_9GAMM|nr:DUF255 domain-containing protein [Pseudolysobacter antarcticus]QBB72153.1 thioredoxin domain-containing protein [Pseudolysobacter antarcticus]
MHRFHKQLFARVFGALSIVFFCAATPLVHASDAGKIVWLHNEADAFAKARAQHRFVLLDLEAVWCHWCHVMDEQTYANPEVAAEISAHYIALRIDQDSRPDIANRYGDFGWPATVVFAADGTEIIKRRGYIEAPRFLSMLKAIVVDPSPIVVATADAAAMPTQHDSALDASTRDELLKRYRDTYDHTLGSLQAAQKFLDYDSVEFAIVHGQSGDATETAMARQTLDAARALFDPAWGGVYQYSTDGDWQHPHFEKLATLQAQYLRVYALAWAAFGKEQDRQAVDSIRGFLDAFLRSPDGAFYVSQDADLHPGEHSDKYFALDDAQRRALGVPRVDKHIYAQQNGMIIESLATWAELGGDATALSEARKSAEWIIKHRALPGGGFRHDEHDAAGPYLADTLAMGRGFLALYRATSERGWLQHASAAADFINLNFSDPNGGFYSAKGAGLIKPLPDFGENVSLARFANLLARYSGKPAHRAAAKHALRYIVNPELALKNLTNPGVLLADTEAQTEPLHLTITGARNDRDAAKLFATVQQLPVWYKRVEWWDRAEGALPNPGVTYPQLKRAAAFVCTESNCSLPIFDPAQIAVFLQKSHEPQSP